MKFTLILLLAGLVQVSAISYSQSTRLSVSTNGKQVAEVLREIEAKSDFRFFYQREQVDVERKVELTIQDKNIYEILGLLFPEDKVSYKIFSDKLILIAPSHIIDDEAEMVLQPNVVTGKIVDENGEPLFGVTIVE
ncbi:MAG: hypothetical protein ACP5E3_05875 [Bacteroidales bacterium]